MPCKKMSALVFTLIFLLFFNFPVRARQGPFPGSRGRGFNHPRYEVGVGSYSHSYESSKRSDSWGGYTLRGTFYTDRHVAGRVDLYGTESDIVDQFGNKLGTSEITGVSTAGLVGTNWGRGFNLFGGFGFYSEDFSWQSQSESWSGYLILYGLGYRWERFTLEFSGQVRDSSDPEKFYENQLGVTNDSSPTYGSASLSLSFKLF